MSEHKIIEIKPVVSVKELQKKINKHTKKKYKTILIVVIVVLAAVLGAYFILKQQTYTGIKISSTTKDEGATENQFVEFCGGYLKYGRDGASLIDHSGDETWNQPYQMQNPVVQISNHSAAIADSGGNGIVVLDKNGIKGEIETLLPIEKISVSEEGVVAALVKDDNSSSIICYDAKGNVLVEHKPSVSSTGYPLDVGISKDGLTLMVSYLYIKDAKYSGKINYFNFGEEGKNKTDNLVGEHEFENAIIPSVYYADKKTSVAVTDTSFMIHKQADAKKDFETYHLNKTIVSTVHTAKYIGFVLQNSGEEGYELRVYNMNGKKILSENVKNKYNHMAMMDKQIFMYEGEQMCIYTLDGVKRFEGNVDENIIGIFPAFGINKYRLITADGLKTIRLVR